MASIGKRPPEQLALGDQRAPLGRAWAGTFLA